MKILHIPKTGGTAIKSTLIPGYRSHPKKKKFLPTVIPDLFVCDHSKKLDTNDQYIFFVRDPIDRFISHFVFLKLKAQGYGTEDYFKNLDAEDKILKKYDNVNDFASDVHKHKLKLIKKMSDTLISPEHVFKCRKNIFFVGRTEFLDPDFIRMQHFFNPKYCYVLDNKYANRRPEALREMTHLDKGPTLNLREYLNKDYEIIKTLIDLNFLKKNYLNAIRY